MNEPAKIIGVVGAGTMGSGIAQLGAISGAKTLLYDPDKDAAIHGLESALANLVRGAKRDLWTAQDAADASDRLATATSLQELDSCELIIEAAPESLNVKRQLFSELAKVVNDGCVLATNTSSLSVTAIAADIPNPGRVVGMHFFNPPALIKLVEVVSGTESNEPSLALTEATSHAMLRETIRATDSPGFVANRCGRPFVLEALRLLEEQVATVEQIDRICRVAGGFKMGPFELTDMVGLDVGFQVSKSFFEQSFGEPRWQPSPLQTMMVDAGRLGRKSGRGYYDYSVTPYREPDQEPPEFGGGEGLIVVAGDGVLAQELRTMAVDAGYTVVLPREVGGQLPHLIIDCGAAEDDPPLEGGPQAVLVADGSLAELGHLVELTKGPYTTDPACQRAELFFATLGKHSEWVGDCAGLVLGRIVSQLISEAAFTLQAGIASIEDIDRATQLGLSYPRGPFAWSDAIGVDHAIAILDALARDSRADRYRIARPMQHNSWTGRLGQHTGAGFYDYEDAW